MTPDDTLSTTARATAACAGPNIWTACVAFLRVTLLKRRVSGLAGTLGVTTGSSLVKPSVLLDNVVTNACPAWPDFDPMIRSMWATSFPSPTSDSPMKKSAAITTSRSGWGARNPAAGVTNAVLRAAWLRGSDEPRGPDFAGSSLRNRIDGKLTCPPGRPVSRPRRKPGIGTFSGATRGAPRPSPRATPRRRATQAAAGSIPAPGESSAWRAARSRASGRAARPAPRAAVGCCAAPPLRAGSRGLDPEGAVVRLAELVRRGAQRRRDTPLREVVLHQADAEVISGALRQHLPTHQPGRRRHPARQETQPQAQPRLVEHGGADPAEESVELPDAPVLSARITEVLPRLEPGGHRLRRGDRRAFVHQQLPQAGSAPGVPVVVVAAQVGNQPPQVGPAGRRCVAHGVRRLMRHPQRQEMRSEPHAVRLWVRPAGEVLEAQECDAASTHHQLAGVGRAHADHQIEVHGAVRLEPVERTLQRVLRDRDDVHIREQPFQIRTVRPQRRRNHLLGVR